MYICHPGMVRMMGYCLEDENVAIVLFVKFQNSMHNLLSSGEFKWLHRTKAACGVASLLKFLHVVPHRMDPFVIRNLRSTHILLDEEYNPKLIDFGMIIGGIFPSLGREPANDIRCTWTTKDDVLSFGLLLQCLISENMKIESDDGCLATSNDIEKTTLVHERLQKDPTYCNEDGKEITRLIVQCVQPDYTCRPTMSEVVEAFQKLKVVETHQEIMCVEKMFWDKCSAEKPMNPSKPNMPRIHRLYI
ncbi:serine/threonine-protein kinase PBL34-like isoform X2 [Impatiens glandulifera]|uniref:serine/threonine-protein kinase PBL34-like isoform X2 n=1 Tax=Impatiens glandulifera TaxID=253017 RepID=UPI001FB06D96|nr:serine/threonine-protein kinase PBL34-like isoform X2 [Impatiens glandulifera]